MGYVITLVGPSGVVRVVEQDGAVVLLNQAGEALESRVYGDGELRIMEMVKVGLRHVGIVSNLNQKMG